MSTPTEDTFVEGTTFPDEFNKKDLWEEISGSRSFSAGKDKVSNIIHPCLRIAHRILSCTLFARKEPGQIPINELFFLWCMTSEGVPKPDFASFFLDKCHTTRSKTAGDICFGGLITIIASGLGVSLSPPHEVLNASIFLDLPALIRMKQIRLFSDSRFLWLHSPSNSPYLILPDSRLEDFDHLNSDTWRPSRTIQEPTEEVAQGDVHMDEASEPHPDSPPRSLPWSSQPPPQFPPDFFTRFDQLVLQTQQNSADLQHIREQQEIANRHIAEMWEYHRRCGHFPPPAPPI